MGGSSLAFSPGLFLSFSPDAQHPVGGVPPPSPWPAVRASNSQTHNLPLRRHVCVLLCSTGTLPAKYILQYLVPGQGAMPLVGCRGETPHGLSHAPPGNCLRDKSSNIRNWVQGTALVQGRSPAWFPSYTFSVPAQIMRPSLRPKSITFSPLKFSRTFCPSL